MSNINLQTPSQFIKICRLEEIKVQPIWRLWFCLWFQLPTCNISLSCFHFNVLLSALWVFWLYRILISKESLVVLQIAEPFQQERLKIRIQANKSAYAYVVMAQTLGEILRGIIPIEVSGNCRCFSGAQHLYIFGPLTLNFANKKKSSVFNYGTSPEHPVEAHKGQERLWACLHCSWEWAQAQVSSPSYDAYPASFRILAEADLVQVCLPKLRSLLPAAL